MGEILYGDRVSLPGSVGVFRWLCLQHPSCSNPQWGWRVVCVGGVCTWGFVIPGWHENNTTHTCCGCLRPCSAPAPACQMGLTQG